MARKLRPGRRRKSGARTASDRLSKAYRTIARNEGTPEARVERLALVNGSGDPSLASSVADVLFSHEILDADQRNAAIRFKVLRDRVFPPATQKRPERPDAQRGNDRRDREGKRHGTTTLLAALNVLEGTLIGRCTKQFEFLKCNIIGDALDTRRRLEGAQLALRRTGMNTKRSWWRSVAVMSWSRSR